MVIGPATDARYLRGHVCELVFRDSRKLAVVGGGYANLCTIPPGFWENWWIVEGEFGGGFRKGEDFQVWRSDEEGGRLADKRLVAEEVG